MTTQGNYGLVEKWSGAGDDLLLRVPLALRLPSSAGGVAGVRCVRVVECARFMERHTVVGQMGQVTP